MSLNSYFPHLLFFAQFLVLLSFSSHSLKNIILTDRAAGHTHRFSQ